MGGLMVTSLVTAVFKDKDEEQEGSATFRMDEVTL